MDKESVLKALVFVYRLLIEIGGIGWGEIGHRKWKEHVMEESNFESNDSRSG